jgi:hypothetical protein
MPLLAARDGLGWDGPGESKFRKTENRYTLAVTAGVIGHELE